MERDVPQVRENACLDNIFQQLQRSTRRFVAVVDPRQRLLGYITAENLTELIMIQSSRAARPQAPMPGGTAAAS
jgi:CBS-domain-containing membrane protein